MMVVPKMILPFVIYFLIQAFLATSDINSDVAELLKEKGFEVQQYYVVKTKKVPVGDYLVGGRDSYCLHAMTTEKNDPQVPPITCKEDFSCNPQIGAGLWRYSDSEDEFVPGICKEIKKS